MSTHLQYPVVTKVENSLFSMLRLKIHNFLGKLDELVRKNEKNIVDFCLIDENLIFFQTSFRIIQ